MRINSYTEQRFRDKFNLMWCNYCSEIHSSEPEGLHLLFESDREEVGP